MGIQTYFFFNYNYRVQFGVTPMTTWSTWFCRLLGGEILPGHSCEDQQRRSRATPWPRWTRPNKRGRLRLPVPPAIETTARSFSLRASWRKAVKGFQLSDGTVLVDGAFLTYCSDMWNENTLPFQQNVNPRFARQNRTQYSFLPPASIDEVTVLFLQWKYSPFF